MTLRGATAEDRLRLQRLGWRPIPVNGKAPKTRNWTSGGTSTERVAADNAAVPDATGTGIITGTVVAFDNDITDAAHALAIENTAVRVLGDTPFMRYGSKPRPALIYRNPHPVGKVTVSGRAPGEARDSLVEFLGKGQQLVAFGPHPGTGESYRWEHEGQFDPLAVGPDDLPETSPAKINEAATAVAATMTALGFTNVAVSGHREKTNADDKSGYPITKACLLAKLRHIDPGCNRNMWLAIAGAIKHAEAHGLVTLPDMATPDAAFDGLTVFTAWSAGEIP